jgi:hypothetical protein
VDEVANYGEPAKVSAEDDLESEGGTSFLQVGDAEVTHREPAAAVIEDLSSGLTTIDDVATGDRRKLGAYYIMLAVSAIVSLIVCYMLVWGSWKNSRKQCCGRRDKVAARPKSQALLCSRAIEFRDPALPDAGASFGIPLTPLSSDSVVERMSFDIAERVRGPMIRADLTRLPGMDAWAKVEISLVGESSSSKMSPCLSCTRVESDSEIETRNVQDAVDSWLSVLYNDKCHDNPEVTGSPEVTGNEDSQSENEQIIKPKAKIKEGKILDGKKRLRPRLEVRDGQGNDLGMIEPDPMGRYVYSHGEVRMVVDACRDQHAVVVSKSGKKCAVATGLKWDGSPELAGQEQADFLQVDTLDDAESSDLLSVLLCVMAPIAFAR